MREWVMLNYMTKRHRYSTRMTYYNVMRMHEESGTQNSESDLARPRATVWRRDALGALARHVSLTKVLSAESARLKCPQVQQTTSLETFEQTLPACQWWRYGPTGKRTKLNSKQVCWEISMHCDKPQLCMWMCYAYGVELIVEKTGVEYTVALRA